MTSQGALESVREALHARPPEGLHLLVVHGSRATGDASPASDWDFGYLADAGFDADALLADLVLRLDTDAIDLADLGRASAQLRFRVAQHGQVVVEPRAGAFADFWLDAVSYWLDMSPIIRAEYEAALARLGP